MEKLNMLAVVLILVAIVYDVSADCTGDKLCCQGRINNCTAHGPRMNNADAKKCFCDSYCLTSQDCCLDFKEHCPAVDCILDDKWGEWGTCSKKCGKGYKLRNKKVLQEAKNGGAKCGQKTARHICWGEECIFPRHSYGGMELRETGKVIPAMYGTWRRNKIYNPYKDPIRKNLFNYYSANSIIQRPSYCAKYEIVESRKACSKSSRKPWSRYLKKGSSICVECQPTAMKRKLGVRCRGHGVFMKETRWNAITVPGCHGKWMMKSRHEDCTCDPHSDMSFILA